MAKYIQDRYPVNRFSVYKEKKRQINRNGLLYREKI